MEPVNNNNNPSGTPSDAMNGSDSLPPTTNVVTVCAIDANNLNVALSQNSEPFKGPTMKLTGYASELSTSILGVVSSDDRPCIPAPPSVEISEKLQLFSRLVAEITDPANQPTLCKPFHQISATHRRVCQILMRSLTQGIVSIEEVERFIEGVATKPGQMYFYANFSKTLDVLAQKDKAKEVFLKFIALAKNHTRCTLTKTPPESDSDYSINALLPTYIDICYGLIVMPKLSHTEVSDLIESIGWTLIQHDIDQKKGILDYTCYAEEVLVLVTLVSRDYPICIEMGPTISQYLKNKPFKPLIHNLVKTYPDREIALTCLYLIGLDQHDLSLDIFKDFIDLGWSHLYDPKIAKVFVETAENKSFLGPDHQSANLTEKDPKLVYADAPFLDTNYGLVSINYFKAPVSDDVNAAYNYLHDFIDAINNSDNKSLKSMLETIVEAIEYKIDDTTIDDIIDHLFEEDPSLLNDTVEELIRSKLIDLGYKDAPYVATKKHLEECVQCLPVPSRNRLEQFFPSKDLIGRHRQIEIMNWLVDTQGLGRLPDLTKDIQGRLNSQSENPLSHTIVSLYGDVLKAISPSNESKKRKADDQLDSMNASKK